MRGTATAKMASRRFSKEGNPERLAETMGVAERQIRFVCNGIPVLEMGRKLKILENAVEGNSQ